MEEEEGEELKPELKEAKLNLEEEMELKIGGVVIVVPNTTSAVCG